MEEYEIRDLFSRKHKTELEIGNILFTHGSNGTSALKIRYIEYLLRFQIHNIGNTIEERFKLEIYIPKLFTQTETKMELLKFKI
jgi:hypothetical protein